jgi:hypothetical protein
LDFPRRYQHQGSVNWVHGLITRFVEATGLPAYAAANFNNNTMDSSAMLFLLLVLAAVVALAVNHSKEKKNKSEGQ